METKNDILDELVLKALPGRVEKVNAFRSTHYLHNQ